MSGRDASSECQSSDELGRRIIAILGEPAARQLLDVLTHSEEERAALIGTLYAHGKHPLTEVLADIESDPDDLTRLKLVAALQRALER